MAVVVGGVAIDLEASAAKYVAEMDKAARATLSATQRMQSDLGRWRSGFNAIETGIVGAAGRMTRSLVGLAKGFAVGLGGGALAGALSGGGLVMLARQATDTAEKLVDAADKAGLTTDAYQELVFQAQQAGASQDTLNTALLAFGVRMGEARSGTGSLVTTMQKLNPALAEAVRNATSQEQALRIVADAMANAGSQADALAIAQAAFSRGGRDMTLVFREGAAGMDAFAAKAREFGLVLDEDLLRKAEQAGDQLDLLAAVIKSQLTGALIEAAPAISQLATALARLIPQIVDAAREWAAWLGIISQTRMQAIQAEIGSIDDRLKSFRETLLSIRQSGELPGFIFGGDDPETVAAEIAHLEGRIKDLGTARTGLADELRAVQAAEPPPAVRPLPKFELPEGEAVGSGATSATGTLTTLPPIEETRTITARPLFVDREAFGPPALSANEMAEVARGQEMIAVNEELITQYAAINSAAQTFSQTVAQGLTDAIMHAKSFTDAVMGIAQSLAEAFIQALAFQAVTAAVGTAGGGGLLGGIFPAQPRARGGSVGAGMPYMVGERGPELFMPSRAGSIIPNSELRNGGGGGNVINIDARGGTPGTAAAGVNAALRLAPGAVANAQARGLMGRGKHPF